MSDFEAPLSCTPSWPFATIDRQAVNGDGGMTNRSGFVGGRAPLLIEDVDDPLDDITPCEKVMRSDVEQMTDPSYRGE
ncbi:MAG: hypothetical protein Q9212_001099 [Teloschistes hypoglaucus]